MSKNAFRPFELGSHNCIGQELAMTELRVILALTVQDMDIVPMYPADGPRLFGALVYQGTMVEEVTAHPKHGMPVKVLLRKKA
jgi:cytochrome P450